MAKCMTRKSAQRFCDNDMHKSKNLKRVPWIRSNATRLFNRDGIRMGLYLVA
jgi:hypothetical protein